MKNIFVVGSKPEAFFPTVKPDVIYAANAAIKRVSVNNFSEVMLKGVISNYVFNYESEPCLKALELLNGCEVDELIIINALDGPSDIKVDLKYKNKTHISRRRRFNLFKKAVGIKNIIFWLARTRSIKVIRKNISSIIEKRELTNLKPSTGMVSLLIALDENCKSDNFYIIGVGMDGSSAHFYSSDKYGDKHVHADKMLLKSLLAKGWKITLCDKMYNDFLR